MEQAKDEQISDFIRKQYKSTTEKDIPIADKPTRLAEGRGSVPTPQESYLYEVAMLPPVILFCLK